MKRIVTLFSLAFAIATPAFADSYLYGNNATFGAPYVYQFDKTTGAITNTYTNLSSTNGRGVVVVGSTMYYTSANSGSVYTYNLTTRTDNGPLFTVSGATALSTIAYDGTNLIIGDYSGSNRVFTYTPSGALVKTTTLLGCTGYCDGLEYFQQNGSSFLVSNTGDAQDPYQLYDINGNLLNPNFIAPKAADTGIAYDGTFFYTSEIFNGAIDEWNTNGSFVKTFALTGAPAGFSPLVEDLSADYSQVLPPPPVGVTPEPSSILLLGTGVLGLAGTLRRRLRN